MKKITIIIPCFNVEHSIEQTIFSIINAKNFYKHNIHIYFVNDASEDSTIDTLKKYCNQFKDIMTLIDVDTNVGLAEARNIGLDKIKNTDYVWFIDGGDLVTENSFEIIDNKLEGQDILLFENINVDYISRKEHINKYFIFENDNFENYIINSKFQVWNKIWKYDLIKNLRFNNQLFEDINYTITAFNNAKSILISHEQIYMYVINDSKSITGEISIARYKELVKAIESVKELLTPELYEFLEIQTMSYSIRMLSNKQYKNIDAIRDRIKTLYPEYKSNKYLGDIWHNKNFLKKIFFSLYYKNDFFYGSTKNVFKFINYFRR